MPKTITAISVQKRNPNRVNISLDGEYAFGLARIVAAWLTVGQEIDDEKLKALQKADSVEVAFQRALHFLSYRPRSEAEIKEKLNHQGCDDQVIETVLERLRKNGMVQDHDFARQWVENRNTFRPRSRKALTFELRRKGVSEETIQEVLAEHTDEDQTAYLAASRYARRLKDLEWSEFRKKLNEYLIRRGYSYETVIPVVQAVWTELQPEQDTEE